MSSTVYIEFINYCLRRHLLSNLNNVILLSLVLFIPEGIACLFSRQPADFSEVMLARTSLLNPAPQAFCLFSCYYFWQRRRLRDREMPALSTFWCSVAHGDCSGSPKTNLILQDISHHSISAESADWMLINGTLKQFCLWCGEIVHFRHARWCWDICFLSHLLTLTSPKTWNECASRCHLCPFQMPHHWQWSL